ncbi:MAG: hypothetical protein OXD54_16445 [Candidatus Poribacteria bacterium]|nr:hypothetical protein [Candidatus Poribacteria bacterium]
MLHKFSLFLSLACFVVSMAGCSALLSPQEWSENYALLDGVQASSMQMIDGDINTVGEISSAKKANTRVGSGPAPEIIVSLPEKKIVRRIVIHSDNIKKFKLYADKGGSRLSGTDWQMIKEVQSVRSNPIVIPVLYSYPTDQIRITVLGTTDDAALTRREKTSGIGATVVSSGST